jgi:hypothetical protein
MIYQRQLIVLVADDKTMINQLIWNGK